MDAILSVLPPIRLLNVGSFMPPQSIPYLIILINVFIFRILRQLKSRLILYLFEQQQVTTRRQRIRIISSHEEDHLLREGKLKFLNLLLNELISTCELCADCAELNVIYELHGSLAYGLVLFLLTLLWFQTFGSAHTTPGYLMEDLILIKGLAVFRSNDLYARFLGQSMAMPLAWKFASIYWKYQLLKEHVDMMQVDNCKTSLTTSTTNGFLIEFGCCLVCRLLELASEQLLERETSNNSWRRLIHSMSSFVSTLLVVLSLELSGGYFNPVLASSLEYGCKGIEFYQHVAVFWLGPLLGHVLARDLHKRFIAVPDSSAPKAPQRKNRATGDGSNDGKRLTRSSSGSYKKGKHAD